LDHFCSCDLDTSLLRCLVLTAVLGAKFAAVIKVSCSKPLTSYSVYIFYKMTSACNSAYIIAVIRKDMLTPLFL